MQANSQLLDLLKVIDRIVETDHTEISRDDIDELGMRAAEVRRSFGDEPKDTKTEEMKLG